MRRAPGMMHSVRMVHPMMEELCREAIGANLERKWVVRPEHESCGHERTQRQRKEQDAGDKLATPLTCQTRAHVLQEIAVCRTSLF